MPTDNHETHEQQYSAYAPDHVTGQAPLRRPSNPMVTVVVLFLSIIGITLILIAVMLR